MRVLVSKRNITSCPVEVCEGAHVRSVGLLDGHVIQKASGCSILHSGPPDLDMGLKL